MFETDRGSMTAVRDITLDIREGEFVTLVGPSGCGKSTLLNMAAGLFEPTTGSVHYRDTLVTPYNRRVGYMTQNDHLLPWRDVQGNVMIPLEIRGMPRAEARDRVQQLLDKVGLKGFERAYPAQLSGGMRKRCALARLLAYDPEALLMDEPFGALDAQLRTRMQIEIRRLALELNKTVVFVTHDLDEAVSIADRCVVFTQRPGTIARVVDVPLPRERDLMQLRHDNSYRDLTAELWQLLAPDME
ncbi:ABC transporter ATP-binding protein [Frigidibacter sp. MR17.24]|uniref:ABC transporter ATP-binding protein n=1 Tax=Frigidibacter sp. MR17.24 TaxID=3127345 RepID=UPI003012DDF7